MVGHVTSRPVVFLVSAEAGDFSSLRRVRDIGRPFPGRMSFRDFAVVCCVAFSSFPLLFFGLFLSIYQLSRIIHITFSTYSLMSCSTRLIRHTFKKGTFYILLMLKSKNSFFIRKLRNY